MRNSKVKQSKWYKEAEKELEEKEKKIEEERLKEKSMQKELKVLCPFCNSVWTADMVEELNYSSCIYKSCDRCDGEIKIICSNCKKIVYIKEFEL